MPQQSRSRERVAQILQACRELISETDTMSVTMAAIARRANIPIGSLYQYFPTKSALIVHLFGEWLEEHRNLARKRLAEAASVDDCARVIQTIHMEIYRENRRNRFLRDIWGGIQATRDTREIHIRDNQFYSLMWFEAARRAGSAVPTDTLRVRAIAINEMWDGSIRLAMELSEIEGEALMKESLAVGIDALGMTRPSR